MALDGLELSDATLDLRTSTFRCNLPAATVLNTTISKCILEKLHISHSHLSHCSFVIQSCLAKHTLKHWESCIRQDHMMIRGSGTESVMDL